MLGLMMDYPLTMDRILEHANKLFSDVQVTTKLPDGSFFRYSYSDMYKRVKRMCSSLNKLGVGVGDRVGTFGWNNYQHLELYYSIPSCGGICHTLNIRLSPEQLAYIINHAEDKVIFIDAPLLPLFDKVADKITCVKHYVLYNAPKDIQTNLPVSFYEDLIDDGDENYNWPVTDENQAMGLCYTSGTTGNPKGVLYSHRSMYLHTLGVIQTNSLRLGYEDVVLPVVPQFHAMAWGLPYACALAGARIIMPGPFLQGGPLADMIAEEKVTVAAGVPTIWNGLFAELKSNPRDTSSMRSLVVGGSAMPRALTQAYEDELGIEVLHCWGMTETSPLGTACRLHAGHLKLEKEKRWDIKAIQGRPIAGIELRIVDENGKIVAWDGRTLGELQVRGAWVAKAYFKVEPCAESFTQDGWFRTGDVASINSDGYMKIGDRTKDLVKSGGEWISSVDLENFLMAHPRVLEAAVIAIPDDQWAERPLAAVVPCPGETLTADELAAYLAPNFAKFWLPDHYIFVEAIPKTSVGKFDKKVIRAQYAEGKLA